MFQANENNHDVFWKCYRPTKADELRGAKRYVIFRAFESGQTPEVEVGGQRMILLGSNNYLGLSFHPQVKAAAKEALEKYGTGCAGSRYLNGNLDLHEALEKRLAGFFGKEAAVVSSTGYQSNLGAIACLLNRGEVVITDKLDHASILDGCRMSMGTMARYRHNDMDDLERLLKKFSERAKLIVVDGVFSMEGDIVNLPPVIDLAKRYEARVIVDDAHGIGVFGQNGRGTVEHYDLLEEVDLITGTLSKSLAGIGGFVVGPARVIEWIKHASRPQMFSASLPPATTAAVIAALEVIDTHPELRERLWANREMLKQGLNDLGFDTGQTQSPIIPVIIGEEPLMLKHVVELAERGVFCNPVGSPAVPKGRDMIRTSVMAAHTQDHIGRVLKAFEEVGRINGMID
jgi:8-amino-7-oxononanoate synthase